MSALGEVVTEVGKAEREWARWQLREFVMAIEHIPTLLLWAETAAHKAARPWASLEDREQDAQFAASLFRRAIELESRDKP